MENNKIDKEKLRRRLQYRRRRERAEENTANTRGITSIQDMVNKNSYSVSAVINTQKSGSPGSRSVGSVADLLKKSPPRSAPPPLPIDWPE